MLDIAILEGVRTPFVKAFGPLARVPAQELGRVATVNVLHRAGLRPDQIDQVVFGNVALPPDAANIARVIALQTGIPQDRIAHTVQRNCASGMEAITTAAQLVQLGEARTVVAGGVESMSRIPLLYNDEATGLYLKLGKAKTLWQRLGGLLSFRPRHFKPVFGVQLGLTDPVCGMMMGETAEVLARDFSITREQQDEYALLSHRRAVHAQQRGVLAEEIVPTAADVAGQEIAEDIGPRAEQSPESLAKLRPFFKTDGTVTVGNSCGLTDGAAAVVVTSGEAARAEGRQPLGYLRAYAYAGCEPQRMGLGPVFATTKLLQKTGMKLSDMDLIELNEAFAAQVLACERAFAAESLGQLDPERLNVNGGAIALGHPVGATGTRLVIALLKELKRRNQRWGLATLCVGGGQGAALLLERG